MNNIKNKFFDILFGNNMNPNMCNPNIVNVTISMCVLGYEG